MTTKWHYVYPDKATCDEAREYINDSGWFPIVPRVNGVPAPQNRNTTLWASQSREMITGEWSFQAITSDLLDIVGVSMQERLAFMEPYGQDMRQLGPSDFVQEETIEGI